MKPQIPGGLNCKAHPADPLTASKLYKTAQGPVLTLNTLPSGTLSARSFVKFCRDQTLNESENHRFVHMCLTKTNENI